MLQRFNISYVPFITLLRKYLKAMEIEEIRIISITEINLKHFYENFIL